MEQLSIEEKARAYDEAINKIIDVVEAGTIEQGLAEWIFPELKESDDEEIRKDLIKALNQFTNGHTSILYKNEDFLKWIAWVEKQGEHINFLNKIQVGDKVTRNQDGVLVNLSQLKRVAKSEQKSAEEYNITGIGSKHAEGKLGEMIKNLKPINEVMQQKWSEEDDIMVYDIDNALRCQITYPLSKIQSMLTWINNLKDRVLSQLEQD